MENLLFFYGLECPHCIIMESLVDKLVKEGYKIEKVEIWHNKENEDLFTSLDVGDECCGGVPFFYNQQNKKTVCGEVSYEELKKWADSK